MRRKGILEFIKRCLIDAEYNKKISNNARVIRIMKKLRKDLYVHYTFLDIEKGGKRCHHRLRFYLLYMDKNNPSFEEVANETYVDIDTIKYYYRLYNKTVLKFVIEESNVNPDYAFLLREYRKSEE